MLDPHPDHPDTFFVHTVGVGIVRGLDDLLLTGGKVNNAATICYQRKRNIHCCLGLTIGVKKFCISNIYILYVIYIWKYCINMQSIFVFKIFLAAVSIMIILKCFDVKI